MGLRHLPEAREQAGVFLAEADVALHLFKGRLGAQGANDIIHVAESSAGLTFDSLELPLPELLSARFLQGSTHLLEAALARGGRRS